MRLTVLVLCALILVGVVTPAVSAQDSLSVAPDSAEVLAALDSILTLLDSGNFEEFACFLLDEGEVNMGLNCGMLEFELKKYQMVKRVETGFSFLAKKEERDELRRNIASGSVALENNSKFTSLFFPGDCNYLLVFGKADSQCYLRAIYDRHPDCCPAIK